LERKWNKSSGKKELHELIDAESPDILCVQETKAWEEQLDESLINEIL
jgi:exonuclease III